MTCYNPIMGYHSAEDNDNGNRYITFNHRQGFTDLPIFLPCGKCIGCRLEYSRWWALRCVNEASLYDENMFLTLTYNNENLPEGGTLIKSEIPSFMKRLRRRHDGRKIRFFGCGEYGDQGDRPHYHILIFGYSPKDKTKLHAGAFRRYKNRWCKMQDNALYISREISSIWQEKGFITIGDIGFESAAYTARYCIKKIKGPKAKEIYNEREPPFALMSRNPGIGKPWIEKYLYDVYPKDFVKIRGRNLRPCRYYDDYLKEVNPDMYRKVKAKRFSKVEKYPNHLENARKEKVKQLKADKLLRRQLHE